MPQPPTPRPNDCFHCPQGDKASLDTYRPGAWLAGAPAESVPTTSDRRSRAGEIEATVQQALRKLQKAVAGEAEDPASLADGKERSSFRRGPDA